MNNYCRNCGEKMSGTICEKCGAHVIDKRVNIEEKRKEMDAFHSLEIKYIVIVVLIPAIAYVITYICALLNIHEFGNVIFPLAILGDIIFAIHVRIKMANSSLIRTLFLIASILLVFYGIGFILLMIMCNSFVRGI